MALNFEIPPTQKRTEKILATFHGQEEKDQCAEEEEFCNGRTYTKGFPKTLTKSDEWDR